MTRSCRWYSPYQSTPLLYVYNILQPPLRKQPSLEGVDFMISRNGIGNADVAEKPKRARFAKILIISVHPRVKDASSSHWWLHRMIKMVSKGVPDLPCGLFGLFESVKIRSTLTSPMGEATQGCKHHVIQLTWAEKVWHFMKVLVLICQLHDLYSAFSSLIKDDSRISMDLSS